MALQVAGFNIKGITCGYYDTHQLVRRVCSDNLSYGINNLLYGIKCRYRKSLRQLLLCKHYFHPLNASRVPTKPCLKEILHKGLGDVKLRHCSRNGVKLYTTIGLTSKLEETPNCAFFFGKQPMANISDICVTARYQYARTTPKFRKVPSSTVRIIIQFLH